MYKNDSKHKSDLVIKFISDGFMDRGTCLHTLLPDLNPLKNIWVWLKRRISEDLSNEFQSLKNLIRRHFGIVQQ